MARSLFGGTSADGVYSTFAFGGRELLALATATLTFWTAETGGTRHTDLLLGGVPVTQITTALGQVPAFQGPDLVAEMWADDGDTQRVLMVTQGRQGLPGVNAVPADEAVATYAGTAGTATNAALSATFVGGSRSGTDAARALRDRAFRTWDSQVADPTITPRLWIYGHSVVAGTGASDTYHKFATLLQGRVTGKRSGAVVTSEGTGGYTTAQLLAGLPGGFAASPAGSVGCVVIMGLLNDYYYGTSAATVTANLTSIISTLRAHASAAPDMTVVIALEWLREPVGFTVTVPWTTYQGVARAVADADPGVTIIDLGSRMGDVVGNPLPIYFDGAHPNDRGHAIVAALLDAELMRGMSVTPTLASSVILAGSPPVAQTTWTNITRDTDNQFIRASATTVNSEITYQFVGDAGHYTIMLDHRKQVNCGIYDLYLDDVLQGAGAQWDGYAEFNADANSTIANFYVPTSGAHLLRLLMATKNAASSGYAGSIRGIYVTRIGV